MARHDMHRRDREGRPSVLLAGSAREAEDIVVCELERLAGRSREEIEPPARVVVPSRALRHHLSARLASRGPLLGVRVQTLRSTAAEILDRAGEPVPLERTLLEVLAAREAARWPELANALAGLEDGTSVLAASVRDLLDAGFGEPHVEAVAELLAGLTFDPAAVARARALIEVATTVGEALDAAHAGGSALLFRRAAHHLAAVGAAALPSREVLIHGFANATGTSLDLLEALVTHLGARAVVDLPAEAASPARCNRAELFTRRLRERLAGVRGEAPVAVTAQEGPRIRTIRAEGVEGEVRAVAAEVATLLERGAVPERIAVVARRLAAFEPALAVQFGRLGVPFTVQGGCGVTGSARRGVRAFVRLLQRGLDTPLDTWLALGADANAEEDVRIGLRVAGVTTLGELAELRLETLLGSESSLALPVRIGLEAAEDGEQPRLLARRRRVARGELERAVAEARSVCELLGGPPPGPAARHLAIVRELGRRCGGPAGCEEVLAAALDELAAAIPADIVLEWAETLLLLRRALAEAGREALGGQGGGVQVLGVTQARGLTFDHLFLLGLNRDVFPRVVSEDPLFPDRLRTVLLPLLPDLPIKALGHEEERYLFAHLLGAAREVTISWQLADDDGKALPPSPFVQRLLLASGGGRIEEVSAAKAPATLLEHAVEAGLAGDRDLWERILALDLAAAGGSPCLAGVRRRVLDEADPDVRTPEGRWVASQPGPYLGAVGPAAELEGQLFVTTLEAIATCPWQAFLRRVLKLDVVPDPAQELGSLPPGLVGNVVHAVLAAIAGGESGATWEEVLAGPLRDVRWPAEDGLVSLAAETASRIGRLAGIASPGLLAALARRALPVLEIARQLEWQGAGPPVVGVEVSGWVEVQDLAGRLRRVGFMCDRVDRQPGGEVVATDYKSGRRKKLPERDSARRKHLLRAMCRGETLQAAAYACAPGAGSGRYLYLDPSLGEGAREAAVAANDVEAVQAFRSTAAVLLGMWDAGLFPPRLVEPSGSAKPRACERCEMVTACAQHDSAARRRLAHWAADPVGTGPLEAWWRLPLAADVEEEA